MPIYIHKIEDFLTTVEGEQRLDGYIPSDILSGHRAGEKLNCTGRDDFGEHDPMGVSGVTIAKGVDLGQTNAPELRGMGVEDAVINQLAPYLGRKDADAVEALHRTGGLHISKATADMLDSRVHAWHLGHISGRYDRDAGAGAFASLPWQAQAVIFSLLYQRGVNSPSKFPNTWASLVKRDWKDAAARLCNASLWLGYHDRRAQEGRLLKEVC